MLICCFVHFFDTFNFFFIPDSIYVCMCMYVWYNDDLKARHDETTINTTI